LRSDPKPLLICYLQVVAHPACGKGRPAGMQPQVLALAVDVISPWEYITASQSQPCRWWRTRRAGQGTASGHAQVLALGVDATLL